MPRFVFRKRSGATNRPVKDLAEHASALGAKVLSQTGTMLYIEGSEELFKQLNAAAPGYVSSPEAKVELPKPPRVSIKKETSRVNKK